MALINCPECNASVSDVATSCPQCGYPLGTSAAGRMPLQKGPEPGAPRNGKPGMSTVAWMGIAVVIVIFALFALIGTCNWQPV